MFTQRGWVKASVVLIVSVLASVAMAGQAEAKVVPVELNARKATVKVAPGVRMKAWTFNGSVPGPVIRASVGDTIEVTLNNRDRATHTKCPKKKGRKRSNCVAENHRQMAMAHSVDFHAARIAPSDAFRSVAPGDSITYSFEATTPGVYMYHCGTMPMLEHIGMGMYGMIVIDPPVARPPAKEIFLVQSEFYGKVSKGWLKPDLEAMRSRPPKYVAFNGTAMKYVDDPIEVGVGEPLRIYFVDAGPSLTSSFHVVGTIFDEYQHDGDVTEALHNVSTQLVGPGGGGVFELTLPQAGRYPFVSHSVIDMDKGAVGMLEAG